MDLILKVKTAKQNDERIDDVDDKIESKVRNSVFCKLLILKSLTKLRILNSPRPDNFWRIKKETTEEKTTFLKEIF
jgi:hypothetical protein